MKLYLIRNTFLNVGLMQSNNDGLYNRITACGGVIAANQ